VRSGGFSIVHVESAKFADRAEAILSKRDGRDGGDRGSFFSGVEA
jgi:hypothetical protein